jgi:hypothetical protein
VIPHQIGGPNLARSSSQPGSFQFLIALFVDCATRLYVDRAMSKLSFALLAVYLIVMTALIADIYLLAGSCPVTIKIANMLLAGGYCDE